MRGLNRVDSGFSPRITPEVDSTSSVGDHRQHYVDLTGRLAFDHFLAAIAAGDIHVGPVSGPVHVAAAAGQPSVVNYGGYEHPDSSSHPGNINIDTALSCSPWWLQREPCLYHRVCLSRISPERVEEAIASLAQVETPEVHGPLEQMREKLVARPRQHLEWRTSREDRLPRWIRR